MYCVNSRYRAFSRLFLLRVAKIRAEPCLKSSLSSITGYLKKDFEKNSQQSALQLGSNEKNLCHSIFTMLLGQTRLSSTALPLMEWSENKSEKKRQPLQISKTYRYQSSGNHSCDKTVKVRLAREKIFRYFFFVKVELFVVHFCFEYEFYLIPKNLWTLFVSMCTVQGVFSGRCTYESGMKKGFILVHVISWLQWLM